MRINHLDVTLNNSCEILTLWNSDYLCQIKRAPNDCLGWYNEMSIRVHCINKNKF